MAQRNHRYFSVIVEPEDPSGDDGPPVPGYGASVGDVLRHARQQAGYSLPDVAGVLRIRLRYLEAIEDGRFDDLPGSVYAVGFIRAYAEFLGLDTEEMVRRFKDEVAGVDRQTELHFPEPVAEGRVPGGAILLIAVVLAAVAYGGWFYMSAENRSFDDMVPRLPDRFAALLSSEPAIEPASEPAAGAGAPPPVAPLAPESMLPETASPEAAPPTAPSGPATAPARAPLPESDGSPSAPTGLAGAGSPSAGAASDARRIASAPPQAENPVEDPAAAAPAPDAAGAQAGAAAQDDGPPPVADPAGTGPADTATADTATADTATADTATTGTATTGTATTDTAAADVDGSTGAADPNGTAEAGAGPATGADRAADGTTIADAPPPVARPGASSAQAAADPTGGVVLEATADSWVQVRDGAGNLVMTRVLRPGDVYAVPDLPGLTLVTGNAGGLDIRVDGRSVASLGEQGEVVRGVSLDARALLDGPPR